MRRIFFTTTMFILMFSISLLAQNRVAVIPFTGGNADDGATIATFFEIEMKESSNYFEVLPRTKAMRDFSREAKYRKTSITDADAICRIGRLSGADYVVTGHIQKLGIENVLILNITEVATYRKMSGAYCRYSGLGHARDQLPSMIQSMVYYTLAYRNNNAPKLAAVPFDMMLKNTTKEIEASLLVDMLTGEIANTGRYSVIQRTSIIDMIMYEEEIKNSRLTSIYIMEKIGRALGTEYVLSGIVPKHGRDTLVDAQIVNIETADQKSRGRVEYRNMLDGVLVMDDLSYQLVGISPAIDLTHITHHTRQSSSGSTNDTSRSTDNTTSRSNNSRSNNLKTTSMLSEDKNGIKEIRELISGGNVNAKDKNGWNALMYASYYGHTDIASSLISDGANVNAKTNEGVTALMWASAEGNADVVRVLINAKADVNAKNKKGSTALSWATTYGNTEIINLLKRAGAK